MQRGHDTTETKTDTKKETDTDTNTNTDTNTDTDTDTETGQMVKKMDPKPNKDPSNVARGEAAQRNPKVQAARFKKGNAIWKLAPTRGPKPIYMDPADLEADLIEFFQWLADNPIKVVKPMSSGGSVRKVKLEHPRAPTKERLCAFLHISVDTWREMGNRGGEQSEIAAVVARADRLIYAMKFEGAAAEVFNPAIIARELGLAEKLDHRSGDGSMTPTSIDWANVPKEARQAVLDAVLKHDHEAKGQEDGNTPRKRRRRPGQEAPGSEGSATGG